MNLNYLAFFLISFVPLIIAAIWYRPKVSVGQIFMAFVLSFMIVYGYINLIIHQMGFYELFFTDIMKGSEEAPMIVEEFMSKYGDKHRHFGHGVFHGAINAFVFALPFIGFFALLQKQSWKWVFRHFGYWLVTSMIIGGLISEFV